MPWRKRLLVASHGKPLMFLRPSVKFLFSLATVAATAASRAVGWDGNYCFQVVPPAEVMRDMIGAEEFNSRSAMVVRFFEDNLL